MGGARRRQVSRSHLTGTNNNIPLIFLAELRGVKIWTHSEEEKGPLGCDFEYSLGGYVLR
jgi:hypothetical protein